jgi:hypothetical protein
VQRHLAGIARAETVLGFRAETTLPEGLAKLLHHLQTRSEAALLVGQIPEVNWAAVAGKAA